MSNFIDTVRDGMAENSGDKALCHLGELLTAWAEKNRDKAAKAETDGKTLKGAMDAIRAEARKQTSGSTGVVSDADGVVIALEYFGIKQETQSSADSLDLDALLGS